MTALSYSPVGTTQPRNLENISLLFNGLYGCRGRRLRGCAVAEGCPLSNAAALLQYKKGR
jgi:hypothetical protein